MSNNVGFTAQEIGQLIPEAVHLTSATPQHGEIIFHTGSTNDSKELLRVSLDGITAPSDVPIDEAARLILKTMDNHIKNMVADSWVRLSEDELRECYSVALQYDIDLAIVIQDKFIKKNRMRLQEREFGDGKN